MENKEHKADTKNTKKQVKLKENVVLCVLRCALRAPRKPYIIM